MGLENSLNFRRSKGVSQERTFLAEETAFRKNKLWKILKEMGIQNLTYKPSLNMEVCPFLVSTAKPWGQLALLQGILKERISGQQMAPAASRVLSLYSLLGASEPRAARLLAG